MAGTGSSGPSIPSGDSQRRGLPRAAGYAAASLAAVTLGAGMAGAQPTKGIAFSSFFLLLGSALVLGLASLAQLLADALRRGGPLPPSAAAAWGATAGALSAGLAYGAVLAEGEASSLYWHLVFLAYLPASVNIGAHLVLVASLLRWRPAPRDQRSFGVIALVGSVGALFLTGAFLRFDLRDLGTPGLVLAIMGLLAHIGLQRATRGSVRQV